MNVNIMNVNVTGVINVNTALATFAFKRKPFTVYLSLGIGSQFPNFMMFFFLEGDARANLTVR